MLLTTIIFSLLALVLLFINARKNKHRAGLKAAGKQLTRVLPLVLVAFLLAGMIETLIPEAFVRQWLATEAGFKGIFLGTVGGTLLAMGPYASFPIIASIYTAGAGLGTTVSLVTAWCLLGLSRFPYEAGILGIRFAMLRMSISLPVCIAAGAIAHIIESIL